MKTSLYLLCAVALFGCGEIQHRTTISQPYGETRTAGVGDLVFKSTTEKSLPNVAGKADLFGRTTPTGTTTVIYQGIREGRAYFLRRSIDIETGATTMNSSPTVVSTGTTTRHTGMVGDTAYSGKSTTQGATIMLPPNTPQAQYNERNTNVIALEVNSLPGVFIVEGTSVKIISADGVSAKYVLEK